MEAHTWIYSSSLHAGPLHQVRDKRFSQHVCVSLCDSSLSPGGQSQVPEGSRTSRRQQCCECAHRMRTMHCRACTHWHALLSTMNDALKQHTEVITTMLANRRLLREERSRLDTSSTVAAFLLTLFVLYCWRPPARAASLTSILSGRQIKARHRLKRRNARRYHWELLARGARYRGRRRGTGLGVRSHFLPRKFLGSRRQAACQHDYIKYHV